MIKSSKLSVKFANTKKLIKLNNFIDDYTLLVNQFIDILWNENDIPALLPKAITSKVSTNLSARIIQCAGKQASGIVRGTKKKQEKRMWMACELHKQGRHKQARRLKHKINETVVSKPIIDHVNPELDSRFVKMDFDNLTTFDGYITLSSFYKKSKIIIPVKKSKHFNELAVIGTLKVGIRLNKKYMTFMFELPDAPKRQQGSVIGIDIGQNDVISCSNGFQSKPDQHNHTLKSICDRLVKKKKGSKSFCKTQQHRTNFINYSINQLNIDNVKEIRLENIKNMRKGMRSSKSLSHWTYTEIFDKIAAKCQDAGVQIKTISPTYTSQRCSVCGWTRKSNRNRKQFKCGNCGFTHDSDLNASINISLDLKPLGKKERLQKINKQGFYWLAVGQALIVPDVQKTYTVLYS